MATERVIIDLEVATSADDGEIEDDRHLYNTALYWGITVGNYIGPVRKWDGYYRFRSVTIPLGAIIDVAYATVYVNSRRGSPLTKIAADDQANPPVVASASDFEGRTRTSNKIDWDYTGGINAWVNTPSLVSVIQELVDSYDYSAGGAIQLLHDDDGSAQEEYNEITFRSMDYRFENSAPKLHIEYLIEVQPTPYTLTINTIGQGTTDPAPGSWQYAVGEAVSIAATPAAGWQFSHWEGDVGGVINPLAFYMPNYDVSITAVFEEIPAIMHTVTIEVSGAGVTIPVIGDHIYAEGTVIDVTAIPDTGWKFDYWEGDVSGTDNPINITITQDMTVRAVFTEVIIPPTEHSVAISIIGQGTTDPAAGSYTILDGNYLTVAAYPTAGWQFDHWGGSILTTENPVTVRVLADMTIVAVFIEIVIPTHTVTIAVEGNGTTEPLPGAWEYEEGSQASITAIPTAGWEFKRWEGDLPSTANPLNFTVTVDISVTAVFEEVIVPPEEYAVSISVVGQGSTAPAPDTYQVEAGTIMTITALPAEGWVFDHWGGDISSTDNPVQVVVNADISVVAVFVEEPVTPPEPPWELALGGMIVVGAMAALTKVEM